MMKIGLVLLVSGIVLTLIMIQVMSSALVAHETVPVMTSGENIWLGPYDYRGGEVTIWVEDYYSGWDDRLTFNFYAHENRSMENELWSNWRGSGEERLRTIDRVECELYGGFEDLPADRYYLYYYNGGPWSNDPDPMVEVFIYEDIPGWYTIVWATGVVALTLGGMLVLIVRWKG